MQRAFTTCRCLADKGLSASFRDIRQTRLRDSARRQAQYNASKHPDGFTASDLAQFEPPVGPQGSIYSPEDLSFEAKRPIQLRNRKNRISDRFESAQVNPIHEYKSSTLLSQYVSDLGRILPRQQTGLSATNQLKLVNSIRRAQALTLMPTTAKHPEAVLSRDMRPRSANFFQRPTNR